MRFESGDEVAGQGASLSLVERACWVLDVNEEWLVFIDRVWALEGEGEQVGDRYVERHGEVVSRWLYHQLISLPTRSVSR